VLATSFCSAPGCVWYKCVLVACLVCLVSCIDTVLSSKQQKVPLPQDRPYSSLSWVLLYSKVSKEASTMGRHSHFPCVWGPNGRNFLLGNRKMLPVWVPNTSEMPSNSKKYLSPKTDLINRCPGSFCIQKCQKKRPLLAAMAISHVSGSHTGPTFC